MTQQNTTDHSALFRRPAFAQRLLATRVRGWFVLAIVFLVSVVTFSPFGAGEELSTGSSARKLRQQVLNQIPWARLNAQTKAKISDVLEKPSMYRSLPRMAIQIDPQYLQFLIRHPEVVVNIWELMGITDMKVNRVGPYHLRTDDGAGTTSDMELVFGSHDLHMFYGEGQYEGPVLKKKLRANCVIVMRTSPRNRGPIELTSAGSPIVNRQRQMVCQLDVFLKIQNPTAGLVVRTIAPIVGPTADHNFVESMKFLQRLNETTESNGYGVQEMGKKLSVVPSVQSKFIQVAGGVYERAVARAATQSGKYDIELGLPVPNSSSMRASPVGAQPIQGSVYPVQQSNFHAARQPRRDQTNLPQVVSPAHWQNATRQYHAPLGPNVRRAYFTDQR